MRLLLDTHFLLWALLDAKRLAKYPWLERHAPWGVSPVSLLEIQFLFEVGQLEILQPEFAEVVLDDPRFVVDEVPLLALVRHALALGWTRDPFDRLLVAHSMARRTPLCTLDRSIHENHALVPRELVD